MTTNEASKDTIEALDQTPVMLGDVLRGCFFAGKGFQHIATPTRKSVCTRLTNLAAALEKEDHLLEATMLRAIVASANDFGT